MNAKIIINCGLTQGNVHMALPFYVVENEYGRFFCNWTPGPSLDVAQFSDLGQLKVEQMAALQADWLAPEKRLAIIRVVNGEGGSIQDKIECHLETLAPGTMAMFILPSNKDDHYFLDALKMRPARSSVVSTMEAEGLTLDPESQFKTADIKVKRQ